MNPFNAFPALCVLLITGPAKTSFGYHVFEVTKIARASQQTLAQAKPAVKQLLSSQNQQKRLSSWLEDFRAEWRAKTECLKAYVTPDCKNGPKPVLAGRPAQQPPPQTSPPNK